VWSKALAKCFRIIDNDDTRITVDADATGAGADDIAVYPDKIAFLIANVTAAGYRYMRIRIPVTAMSEDYWRIGLIVSGRIFDISSPHPAWSWVVNESANVPEQEMPGGYVYASKIGEPKRTWSLAFDGMRNRPDRAGVTYAPGGRGGYEKLLDTIKRLEFGAGVCALLPEYDDHMTKSNFGYRELDVWPVRVFGPWEGAQQAYETYCSELVRRAILDMSKLKIVEVL
jgi:hypothetical protein